MQWRTLNAMLEHTEDSELYAVGDISQSIYGFRGAVPEYLQHLINAGTLTVYELRSNYRSSPAIVEVANSLIRHNTSTVCWKCRPCGRQRTYCIVLRN